MSTTYRTVKTATGYNVLDENDVVIETHNTSGDGEEILVTSDSPYDEDFAAPGSSSGGGGGSSPILVATLVLTDAQIKALPTTPLIIVAAPGLTKYHVPFLWSMELDRSHGAYTNVAQSDLLDGASIIRLCHGPNAVDALRPVPMEGISGAHGTKRVGFTSGTYNVDNPVTVLNQLYMPVYSFPANNVDRLENLPLYIGADNQSSGNFTGGGSGNAMALTVWYATRTWLSATN